MQKKNLLFIITAQKLPQKFIYIFVATGSPGQKEF
jgi:hypothetical protein